MKAGDRGLRVDVRSSSSTGAYRGSIMHRSRCAHHQPRVLCKRGGGKCQKQSVEGSSGHDQTKSPWCARSPSSATVGLPRDFAFGLPFGVVEYQVRCSAMSSQQEHLFNQLPNFGDRPSRWALCVQVNTPTSPRDRIKGAKMPDARAL